MSEEKKLVEPKKKRKRKVISQKDASPFYSTDAKEDNQPTDNSEVLEEKKDNNIY